MNYLAKTETNRENSILFSAYHNYFWLHKSNMDESYSSWNLAYILLIVSAIVIAVLVISAFVFSNNSVTSSQNTVDLDMDSEDEEDDDPPPVYNASNNTLPAVKDTVLVDESMNTPIKQAETQVETQLVNPDLGISSESKQVESSTSIPDKKLTLTPNPKPVKFLSDVDAIPEKSSEFDLTSTTEQKIKQSIEEVFAISITGLSEDEPQLLTGEGSLPSDFSSPTEKSDKSHDKRKKRRQSGTIDKPVNIK